MCGACKNLTSDIRSIDYCYIRALTIISNAIGSAPISIAKWAMCLKCKPVSNFARFARYCDAGISFSTQLKKIRACSAQ